MIVDGVYDGRPRAMTSSMNSGGAKASSALPTPVAWSGRRPPTREVIGTDRSPRIFSTTSASYPSRTAS